MAELTRGDTEPLKGRVVNVSRHSFFLLTTATQIPSEGDLVGVTMHLDVGGIPGATVDVEATGRVLRVEVGTHQTGIALQFDRDLGIDLDPQAGRASLVILRDLAVNVRDVVIAVSGDVLETRVGEFQAHIRAYASRHGNKVVLDMTRVTYLCRRAIDCLDNLRREFKAADGYLHIVAPRVRLADGPASDDLRQFSLFRRRAYPSLYHALTA